MICRDYRCLFVHIPKTAGQSVEQVFLRLLGLSWETRAPLLLRGNDDPRLGPPRLAHLTAAEYVSCGYLTPAEFGTYFRFSIVRNPWDRIVSEYKYRRHPVTMDFKTYLFKRLPSPGWSEPYRHIIPQHDFLYDEAGRLLVDYVGKIRAPPGRLRRGLRAHRYSVHALAARQPLAGGGAAPQLSGAPEMGCGGRSGAASGHTPFRTTPNTTTTSPGNSSASLYRKDVQAFNYAFDHAGPGQPGQHLSDRW